MPGRATLRHLLVLTTTATSYCNSIGYPPTTRSVASTTRKTSTPTLRSTGYSQGLSFTRHGQARALRTSRKCLHTIVGAIARLTRLRGELESILNSLRSMRIRTEIGRAHV